MEITIASYKEGFVVVFAKVSITEANRKSPIMKNDEFMFE
jgi:hypothetical protein